MWTPRLMKRTLGTHFDLTLPGLRCENTVHCTPGWVYLACVPGLSISGVCTYLAFVPGLSISGVCTWPEYNWRVYLARVYRAYVPGLSISGVCTWPEYIWRVYLAWVPISCLCTWSEYIWRVYLAWVYLACVPVPGLSILYLVYTVSIRTGHTLFGFNNLNSEQIILRKCEKYAPFQKFI